MDINRRERPRTERTPPPVVLKQLSGAECVFGARPLPEVDLTAMSKAVADVCNDAGGARWCPGCLAAHGAWHASCPSCGRVLVALPRLSRIKREAA